MRPAVHRRQWGCWDSHTYTHSRSFGPFAPARSWHGASRFEGNINFLFPSASPFYPSSCPAPDEIYHTKSCNPNIHKEGPGWRNLRFGPLAASFPEEAEEFVLENFAQLSPLLHLYNGERPILPAQLAAQRLAASLCPEKIKFLHLPTQKVCCPSF